MGRKTFDNYGVRADNSENYTVVAGRYEAQSASEVMIVDDVKGKLGLQVTDDFLEIGCGTGNLLIPISFMVKTTTGIDHPAVIKKLKERSGKIISHTYEDNFLDLQINSKYHKILIYSVMHCLGSQIEVMEFIDKAMNLLVPGGRLLIGDVPNADNKKRFLSSSTGSAFSEEWSRLIEHEHKSYKLLNEKLDHDDEFPAFDDSFIIKIVEEVRAKGASCYILPQPPDLPFGHTREDILICKPD